MQHLFYSLLILLVSGCTASHLDEHQQVLRSIAWSEIELEEGDLEASWKFLDSAYLYAEQHDYAEGKAEALLAMSRYHNMMDRVDSAVACLHRGLEVCPLASDSLLAQYYAELSASYNIMGDMAASVQWAQRSLPLLKKYGSEEDYGIICGNTGIAYRRLGQNDSASVFYQRGLETAVAVGDYDTEAYLANNLSVLFAEMGRLDESIYYADKAMEAASQTGDVVEQLSAQANKGIALHLSGKDDEAIGVLIPTFEQADTLDSTPLKLKTLNYLLKTLSDHPANVDVSRYLRRGEELAHGLPPGNTGAAGILEAKMNILASQGKYAEALQTIAQLEELMKLQQVMPRHKLMSMKGKCLAGMGRYSEAYQLLAEATALNDSLRNQENNAKLDELATSYRVMEKELEVARLSQSEAVNQRRIGLLLAALFVLLACIALLLLWMRGRRQRAEMRETQRYVEGIEQERTRFARELHDGACNELLAMGLQLSLPSPDLPLLKSEIKSLRNHLRQLSHELLPPQFSQGVLLNDAVGLYLSHIEGPTVTFQSEGEGWERIPSNTSYHFYRIVQEAIGNVIEHQPEAQVTVSLSLDKDSSLQLSVVSQGEFVSGDGRGVGLQSMRDRAASLGARFSVEQDAGIWRLKVTLP